MQISNKLKAAETRAFVLKDSFGAPRCLPGPGRWNEKSANKVEETALRGPEKLNGKSEG